MLLQTSLQKEMTTYVSSLCQALYLEKFISEQQLRRVIVPLCCGYEQLVALDYPRSASLLDSLLVEFTEMSEILKKILTILPPEFVRIKLAPTFALFC